MLSETSDEFGRTCSSRSQFYSSSSHGGSSLFCHLYQSFGEFPILKTLSLLVQQGDPNSSLALRRWLPIQYIKLSQDLSVVVSSNSTSKFRQRRSKKSSRSRKGRWVMLWRCLRCSHFLVILSRTTNAATVDLKAELLLHLNFKAIVRRSILTSVPIGHVVRSRHSSLSVA